MSAFYGKIIRVVLTRLRQGRNCNFTEIDIYMFLDGKYLIFSLILSLSLLTNNFSPFSLLLSHAIHPSPNHHQACKLLPYWILRLEMDLLSWFYSSSSLSRTTRSLGDLTTSSPHQEKIHEVRVCLFNGSFVDSSKAMFLL
jgi:hypothetical protein